MRNRLVKSVINPTYSVDLYETPDGEYIVQSEVEGGLQHYSMPMDLKSALYAFDQKVQELEGN